MSENYGIWMAVIAALITLFGIVYYATYTGQRELQQTLSKRAVNEAYRDGMRDGEIKALSSRVTDLEKAFVEMTKKLDSVLASLLEKK